MTDPVDMESYMKRFKAGQNIEGHGLGNVHMTSPCPFCAAPMFMRWEMLSVREAMEKGATCNECGRSAKAIFNNISGGVGFEMVQTGGADQPPWLSPKMRRVY